ncbi:MAG: toprim domain-containing protein, partial [Pseudomonadota bacterium]|nr:toprim domain-containing protein [Pseudomonadota bacterium]
VRLVASPQGPAGKWRDLASAEHGDLLDIIRETCDLHTFADVLDEARRFLALPHPLPRQTVRPDMLGRISTPARDAARRLFAMSRPLAGTLAERYLRSRGITLLQACTALRFHPHCYYRPDSHASTETWPALIAAVTDLAGTITGAHRTYLAPCGLDFAGNGKAPLASPRRAMGQLLGHAVRFGIADDVLAVGEGLETVLSLCGVLPTLPLAAGLSAAHVSVLRFPPRLRVLYILRDADGAGAAAVARLTDRAKAAGIEAHVLSPQLGDFNDDLCRLGRAALWAGLKSQLVPEHVARFARPAALDGAG